MEGAIEIGAEEGAARLRASSLEEEGEATTVGGSASPDSTVFVLPLSRFVFVVGF